MTVWFIVNVKYKLSEKRQRHVRSVSNLSNVLMLVMNSQALSGIFARHAETCAPRQQF